MNSPFITYLNGEGPLWKVFWLYGVVPSNLLWVVVLVMLNNSYQIQAVFLLLFILLFYTAWIVIAVWRCADNVKSGHYSILARSLTIAWAINTLFLVLFMALDLTM